MNRNRESKPAPVPFIAPRDPKAKPPGETPSRWDWVQPCVWTDRMLAALENGVKGGRSNAFFAKHGLYTLKTAHALVSQSSSR